MKKDSHRREVQLVKPSWTIGIGFKHEGHERGMAIGPAWWFGPGDLHALEGPRYAPAESLAVNDDGDREWFTLRQVEKIASNFKLKVEEF